MATTVRGTYDEILASKNVIRTKLVELGLAGSTAKLDALAEAISNIIDQGAVSIKVKEGDTVQIPAGYHNGAGTVSGIGGGGNYDLQSKTVTPTKKQQAVTPDAGYYGMSDVTVAAIPDNYQDVSGVTALGPDVLAGKIIVTADGNLVAGEMPDNGAVSKTLDATTITYIIPKGYHSGTGKVEIVVETKTVIPTKSLQTITPTAGNVLSEVKVAAIPDEYQDITGVTATAPDVRAGKTIVTADGENTTGTMKDNGALLLTFDPLTQTTVDIPEGYTSGGVVVLTDDLEKALAEI